MIRISVEMSARKKTSAVFLTRHDRISVEMTAKERLS